MHRITGGRVAIVVGVAITGVLIFIVRSDATTRTAIHEAPTEFAAAQSPSSKLLTARDARRGSLSTGAHDSRESDPVQLPNGQWGLLNPDGSYTMSTRMFERKESTIEGAISVHSMLNDHPREVDILQTGISTTRNIRDKCLSDFIKRGGKISQQYDWILALSFKGDGKQIRVTDVEAPEDRWPSEFDQQAKACYLESFWKINFTSTEVLDMKVEYPLCVKPPAVL